MAVRPELFGEVVALTGVSAVLAPGMVTRALADSGVTPEEATLEHYEEAVPRLKARLKAYMPEEEAERHAGAILVHIAKARGTPARPTPAGLLRYRVKAQLAPVLAGMAEAQDAEAPPRSGVTAVRPGTPAAGVERPRPDPRAADPSHPDTDPSYDDEEYTLVGRRWTADELAAIEALKKK